MATLILAKQRNGPTGDVEVAYQAQKMLFTDLNANYATSAPIDDFAEDSYDELPPFDPGTNFDDEPPFLPPSPNDFFGN